MDIRWSPEAADDFASIVRHIREDNPTEHTGIGVPAPAIHRGLSCKGKHN